MADSPIEEEYFRENEAQLMRRFAGKILLISGRKVVAVYESRAIAEREAKREFGSRHYVLKTVGQPPRSSSSPFRAVT